jgi:nucleotide-binding universal stress UspA family protein
MGAMVTRHASRVIVGVDNTITGLRALRSAVAEARRRGAELHAVRVWRLGLTAGVGVPDLREDLMEYARRCVVDAFSDAMGGPPRDLKIVVTLLEGEPARTLVTYADRDDDVLVVGGNGRDRLRWLHGPGVAAYCATHAVCPVLVVPPAAFAREQRQTAKAIRRDAERIAHSSSGTA